MEIVMALVAAVIGIVVGGVINVLADDLPVPQKLRIPHYPDGIPRPRSAWLGLAAFLTGQRTSPAAETVAEDQGDEPQAAEEQPAGLQQPQAEPIEAQPAAPLVQGETAEEALPAEPNPGVGTEMPARRPSRRLSWRYPLVEVGLGLAYAALVIGYPHERNLLAWFVYMAILLLITVIDMEHRLILFVVIVPSCAFALLVGAISPEQGRSFVEYLIGGAAGFVLFFLMFLGGGLFTAAVQRDEVAFGFGDVMLATLSGFILGWRAFIFAGLITVFVGAFGSLLYMFGRTLVRRRYRWFTPLPYGPYIVLGTLIMLLFREQVQQFLRAGYM
jgi:leader peptidase (prepilin peptidase)/N-methyltransferase